MKKDNLSIIISVVAIVISIISLICTIYPDNKYDNEKPIENEDGCCEGCLCGDTIEMLKNIETAWTLTEINSDGEYICDRHSFINFHGTGKNTYAFFKNEEDGKTIFEKRGKFNINEKNEIVLTPNNKEDDIITCTIGEEKNLIAVMRCNKDFGTFALQKQGTLELPSLIIDVLSKTNTIIVKTNQKLDHKDEYGYKETKTITDLNEINKLTAIINNSKIWTGLVTVPMPKYELELLDDENNLIAKITYSPNFNITMDNKSYNLTDIDNNALDKIIKEY